MTQTRLESLIEALFNVAIGYVINFTANLLIFPLFGWQISVSQNLALGAVFTVISVLRSYAVRRWFNARMKKTASQIAGAVKKCSI